MRRETERGFGQSDKGMRRGLRWQVTVGEGITVGKFPTIDARFACWFETFEAGKT